MYLGRFVESGPAEKIFSDPRHPYTKLLLETIPDVDGPNRERQPLAGEVPSPIDPPPAAHFIRDARWPGQNAVPIAPN